MTSNKNMYIVNKIMGLKTKRYRPSKTSTSFLDQLAKILSFSPSKTRREIIKEKRR